jgi:hypothetical protein
MSDKDLEEELENRLREFGLKYVSGFIYLLVKASFKWGYDYGVFRHSLKLRQQQRLLDELGDEEIH